MGVHSQTFLPKSSLNASLSFGWTEENDYLQLAKDTYSKKKIGSCEVLLICNNLEVNM